MQTIYKKAEMKKISSEEIFLFFAHVKVGCFVVSSVPSTARLFREEPSFTVPCEDAKLGLYTVPTGNRTPGRPMFSLSYIRQNSSASHFYQS